MRTSTSIAILRARRNFLLQAARDLRIVLELPPDDEMDAEVLDAWFERLEGGE